MFEYGGAAPWWTYRSQIKIDGIGRWGWLMMLGAAEDGCWGVATWSERVVVRGRSASPLFGAWLPFDRLRTDGQLLHPMLPQIALPADRADWPEWDLRQVRPDGVVRWLGVVDADRPPLPPGWQRWSGREARATLPPSAPHIPRPRSGGDLRIADGALRRHGA